MARPEARTRAAILAGGTPSLSRAERARLRTADLLICANGGLRAAQRLRLRPDVAIGDFDSAGPALRTWAARHGARIVSHPMEKDMTDTELALDYAISQGVEEVEVFGALGGRLDHLLANVALLTRAGQRGIVMRIVDGDTLAFLAISRTRIPARRGDLVSLLPLSPSVSGVTTAGLRYRLRDATLRRGSTLGVSNIATSSAPTVHVAHGDLIVVVTRRGGTRRMRPS